MGLVAEAGWLPKENQFRSVGSVSCSASDRALMLSGHKEEEAIEVSIWKAQGDDGAGMDKWLEPYHEAMTESNPISLPLLLDNAIDAVLDQIEDTFTRPSGQLRDLTKTLNDVRSRRKEVESTSMRRKAA